MEELEEAVVSLKALVARPGTFVTFFSETTDEDILGVLVDALAECHLEGLLTDHESDEDGLLNNALSSGQAALVILVGATRFLRAELINRDSHVVYEGGGAHYETEQSSTVLRDILGDLKTQRDRAIQAGSTGVASSAFFMADQYIARVCGDSVSW